MSIIARVLMTAAIAGIMATGTADADRFETTFAEATTVGPAPISVDGPTIPAGSTELVHHFPASRETLRFAGETASRTWPVFLTRAQARSAARLRLSLVNAVSVMPEASYLAVHINDVRVAELPLNAAIASRQQTLTVPHGILRPGFNALRIGARQHHRVDCSITGTYELWTQVESARSGFVFPPETAAIRSIDELPALPLDGDGRARLRLVLPAGADTDAIDRAVRIAQQIAVLGAFKRPLVEVAPEPGAGPGLDVIVATGAEASQFPPSLYGLIRRARPIAMAEGRSPGRTMMAVAARSPADMERVLADMAARKPVIESAGTEAGLIALAGHQGYRLEEGTRVPLRRFGVPAQEFNGRLFHAGFDVVMPPDFYAADTGDLEIALAAGYVAGLDADSQLTVRVNDRIAAGLPLPVRDGEVFKNRTIAVPLRFFRPGSNRIDLDVQLSAARDESCDPLAALDEPARFVLLEETEIVMPRVARIAHMPNLAALATSGFPYRAEDGSARLFVPYPDAVSIAAAATLTARMAVAAGRPLTTQLSLTMPKKDAGSALIVGAFKDLSPAVIASAGLEARALRQAWRQPPMDGRMFADLRGSTTSASDGGGFDTGPDWTVTGSVDRNAAPGSATAPVPSRRLPMPARAPSYEAWREAQGRGRSITDLAGDVGDWIGETIGLNAGDLGLTRRDAAPIGAAPSTAIIVAQAEAPGGNATWTLVTAPTAGMLKDGVDILTSETHWNALSDRAGSYDLVSGSLTTVAADRSYYVATQPFSVGNSRRIAAGWFSQNIGFYVAALLMLTLLIGVLSRPLLARAGQKDA